MFSCPQPAPANVASDGTPSGTATITEEADDESPDQSTQQSISLQGPPPRLRLSQVQIEKVAQMTWFCTAG